jgi:hypothetical protein
MKKSILLLGLCAALFASCSEDDSTPLNNPPDEVASENKVLLLKVDLLTNTFEGGKELVFPEADTFTITSEYVTPADFGSLKLIYDEVDQPIFDGTITWMGLGERSYPETLAAAETFAEVEEAVEMPALNQFEYVNYVDDGEMGIIDPEWASFQSIWGAIDNLQQVKAYRESNPNAKINLFVYTPSVGVGNPAEWDWYIMIKN